MTKKFQITKVVALINVLAIFKNEEKEQLIAKLSNLEEKVLSQLLEILQKFKNRQDKVIQNLPSSKIKNLSISINEILKKSLKKSEVATTKQEKVLLNNLENAIYDV